MAKPPQEMDRETERELIAAAQRGDRAAALKLLEQHDCFIWRVVGIARRRNWRGKSLNRDDLRQEAFIYFLERIQKHDLASGYRLSTTAYPHLLQELGRLTNISRLIRLPGHAELIDPAAARKARALGDLPNSYDRAGQPCDPLAVAIAQEELVALRASFASLPPRERRVIELRLSGLIFSQIAARLGITKQRAEQLQAQAIARMRQWLHIRGFD